MPVDPVMSIANLPASPTAEQTRQSGADAGDFLMLGQPGLLIGTLTGCAVSQRAAGANMSVDVAVGQTCCNGVLSPVTAANVAVTAADATHPRFDLVGSTAGTISVVAGTPAANPVFPAIPAGATVLAAVHVGAGVTSIVTADIVDKRVLLYAGTTTGPVLPSAPVEGQLHVHTPIGRSVLCQYQGGAWKALIAYGVTTLYVDVAGTDDPEHGFGIGTDAFRTITYAVSWIAPHFGGTVFVFIGPGTFAETVTVQGKVPNGAYNIIFGGTLTPVLAEFTAASVVAGSGATDGSVTVAGTPWTPSAHKNTWLLGTSGACNATKFLIRDNTDSTITIIDYLTAGVAPGDTFSTYDLATTVNQIATGVGQSTVYLYDLVLVLPTGFNLQCGPFSTLNINRCKQVFTGGGGNIGADSFGYLYLTSCYFELAQVQCRTNGAARIFGCIFVNCYSTSAILAAHSGTQILLFGRNLIDGTGSAVKVGLMAMFGAELNLNHAYTDVRNWGGVGAYGLRALQSGFIVNAEHVVYTSDYTNYLADAATFGWIA